MMPIEVQKNSLPCNIGKHKDHWFMDMYFEGLPIGIDPLTKEPIFWGEGQQLACILCEEHPDILNGDIPF